MANELGVQGLGATHPGLGAARGVWVQSRVEVFVQSQSAEWKTVARVLFRIAIYSQLLIAIAISCCASHLHGWSRFIFLFNWGLFFWAVIAGTIAHYQPLRYIVCMILSYVLFMVSTLHGVYHSNEIDKQACLAKICNRL